ncbi:SAM-dependent methyltransferase [bacterium]|nr:SAM-dependent methyltransferase [bacterium]
MAQETKKIQTLVSDLVIQPEYDGILDGIEAFSHALILYWPHLLPDHGRTLRKVHPIGRKEFPLVGIFSTCSPARPNPVLVTAAQIINRQNNILRVQGLEAVSGSPIIDIKPYTSAYCQVKNFKVSDWMARIQQAMSEA